MRRFAVGCESQAVEPRLAIHTVSLGMLYYYARDYRQRLTELTEPLRATLRPALRCADFGFGPNLLSSRHAMSKRLPALEKAVAADRNSGWLVELARAYCGRGTVVR